MSEYEKLFIEVYRELDEVQQEAILAYLAASAEGAGPLQALTAENIVLVAAGYGPIPWEKRWRYE